MECSDGTEVYCRWFIPGTWSRDQQSTGSPPSLELLFHLEFCLDDHQKYIVPLLHITCSNGPLTWHVIAIGFASRRYTPPVKGLSEFRGDIYHTAVWPQHDVNLMVKRWHKLALAQAESKSSRRLDLKLIT